MSNENVTITTGMEETSIAPVAMPLSVARDRVRALAGFREAVMVAGVDFGTIPGAGNKPTLLKPGAEKLCTFFGLSAVMELVDKIEQWGDDGSEPLFSYDYRCKLYDSRGRLIASTDANCNSREVKYRYRYRGKVCPECGSDALIKSKYPDRETGLLGWYCNARRGGCGKNFGPDDPAIVNQQAGKVVNHDTADIINTLKKMAQKRALVGSVLLGVNASEFFTQDLEDLAEFSAKVVVATEEEQQAVVRERTELLEAVKAGLKELYRGNDDTDWETESFGISEYVSKGRTNKLDGLTIDELSKVSTQLTRKLEEKAAAKQEEGASEEEVDQEEIDRIGVDTEKELPF